MIETGGQWDRDAWPRYFIAEALSNLPHTMPYATDHLVPVNEIRTASDEQIVETALNAGVSVLLDSGVYNLALIHADAHGLSMNEALASAPEDIDGFHDLFNRYVTLLTRWQDRLWGAVEIDFGGRENKIRTRDRLEAMGLRPIPVYHPLSDGWDYFDFLAERYDRICFGNVAVADLTTRKRLVATAWDRRRKYPDLWIHLLGLTPSSLTVALPINSCDSSTWVAPARWGHMSCHAATQRLWDVGAGFCYDRASDTASERGHRKAWGLAALEAHLVGYTMRRMAEDQRRELGCDPTGGSLVGWRPPEPAEMEPKGPAK